MTVAEFRAAWAALEHARRSIGVIPDDDEVEVVMRATIRPVAGGVQLTGAVQKIEHRGARVIIHAEE